MRGEWEADQIKFIEWLATPRYTRAPPTIEMFAKTIGVDDSTLYRWQNLEGFRDDVNDIARQSLKHKLPEVYGALLREAETGSFQHIQLVLEMSGDYVRQQRNINQNKLEGDLTIHFVEAEVAADDNA